VRAFCFSCARILLFLEKETRQSHIKGIWYYGSFTQRIERDMYIRGWSFQKNLLCAQQVYVEYILVTYHIYVGYILLTYHK
jgi:hypothetical protein